MKAYGDKRCGVDRKVHQLTIIVLITFIEVVSVLSLTLLLIDGVLWILQVFNSILHLLGFLIHYEAIYG